MTYLELYQRQAGDGLDGDQLKTLIARSHRLRAEAMAEFFGHPIRSLRRWFA